MCYANPMTVLYYLWSCAFSIQLPPDKIDLDWVKRDIRFQPLLCWCISTDPLTTASLLLMPLVLLSVEILFGVSPIPSVSLPLQLLSPSPLRQMETGRERNSHNMRVNEWEFNIRDISSALRNPSSQGHVDAGGIYHLPAVLLSRSPCKSKLLARFSKTLFSSPNPTCNSVRPLIRYPWACRSVDDGNLIGRFRCDDPEKSLQPKTDTYTI